MFAVVYSAQVMGPAVLDPEVGMNWMMMVHGSQEFVWGPPVVAGDEITTTVSVKDINERGGMGFYVFESASDNQRGERVCTGDVDQHRARGVSMAELTEGATLPELRVTPDRF